MSKFLGILLTLFASVATAGSATLTWTAPLTNTDNSPLIGPVTYSVYEGASGVSKNLVVSGLTGLTYTVGGLVGGSKPCFVVVDVVAGILSAASNETCTIVPLPTPNPPTGLTVTAVTAYQPVAQTNAYIMVAVGTVPFGTKCLGSQSVNGRYVVARSFVKWNSSNRPPVVVASCA